MRPQAARLGREHGDGFFFSFFLHSSLLGDGFFPLGLLPNPPLHPNPSAAAPELLRINKPNAARFPEAAGWTTREGTVV